MYQTSYSLVFRLKQKNGKYVAFTLDNLAVMEETDEKSITRVKLKNGDTYLVQHDLHKLVDQVENPS